MISTELPRDPEPIIHQAIASGRGCDEADVVRQALRLCALVDQRRESLRRDIVRGVGSGDAISGEVVFRELEPLTKPVGQMRF